MTNHVEGKTIVVTGAASGFGRLLCEKASVLGGRIVAADVQSEMLDEVVAGIGANNREALGVVADVTDLEQMHAVAAQAIEHFGSIDVMVNNAGVMPLAFFADHERAHAAWVRCIDINFKGVLNGIAAAHNQMIRQGRGHVVNISSIYGNYPTAGGGVYGATKAAVVFLSESLRIESQGKIKVTTVRPTGVPATGLGAGVINPEAPLGLLGANGAEYFAKFGAAQAGELPAQMLDRNDIEYFALDPETIAEQTLHAINQPWGVSISDVTVRASGDGYVI